MGSPRPASPLDPRSLPWPRPHRRHGPFGALTRKPPRPSLTGRCRTHPEYTSSDFDVRDQLRAFMDLNSSRCVVAVESGGDEDKVVGYAMTIMGEYARAWLISLAVLPDRRGCGYGHGLLRRSVEVCQEKGDVDEVWLTVDPQNVAAYRLFKDFGFVLREHDERYFGHDEPRDVLVYKTAR
ncbi:GNAT family N-acetyltransferase [Nocardia sp. FBN12]|uniref:GNAT family N-acetyltransferase n=1 Tax=Nocardia sp. FBN12 TaxID=3419766 RepID=UPI003CFC9471